jgi:hypothetical protein
VAAPAASKRKKQRQLKSFLEGWREGMVYYRLYYRLYAETWKQKERLAIWVIRIVAASRIWGHYREKLGLEKVGRR